jgi:hypothetical protein
MEKITGPDDWLKSYETGVPVFLIVVAAALLGLIFWAWSVAKLRHLIAQSAN